MATRAADDFATIRQRIAELQRAEGRAASDRAGEAAMPRCPLAPGLHSLEECLRHPQPCAARCPHRDLWTGPEAVRTLVPTGEYERAAAQLRYLLARHGLKLSRRGGE